MFEKLWPRTISVLSTWRWYVVSALVLYIALMALNWADVVHPFWVLTVLALIEVLRGTPEVLTRLIVAAGVFIGAVPVTGWLHLPTIIDPICALLVVWSQLLVHEIQKSGFRPTVHSITPVPAFVGGLLTYQWWSGLSKGSPSVVLERLLPIWDFAAHFHFFLSNLFERTYIAQSAGPGAGLVWAGREYPSGIHFVWSLFASGLSNEVKTDSTRAIPVFANSVTVTLAIAVGITGVCIGRIGRTCLERLVLTALGTGLAVGLLALGPISQSIWAGFANMPAVLIGLSILISICVSPFDSYRQQLMMLVFASWIVLYNWFPAILLVLLAIVNQGIRIANRQGWRVVLFATFLAIAGAALPLWYASSLGMSHLQDQGGVQPFPLGILVGSVLCAFALGLFGVGSRVLQQATFLLLPPAVLLVVHGTRLRIITDGYPYYFHKAGLFVGSFVLISTLAIIAFYVVCRSPSVEQSRRTTASRVTAAVVASFGLSQIFGYWGPDYPTLGAGATAIGVAYRNDITKGSDDFLPTAQIVVRESRNVRQRPIQERSCLILAIPNRLGVLPTDNPKFGGTANAWKDVLANVWFHGLTRSYTTNSHEQSYMSPNIAGSLGDEREMVKAISATFDPQSMCVFSSKIVNLELNYMRPVWRTRDLKE
jgi:hypothetical protein